MSSMLYFFNNMGIHIPSSAKLGKVSRMKAKKHNAIFLIYWYF